MVVENYIFFKRHSMPEKGCSSHLSRFRNIVLSYWYKRQAELRVRLHHVRKHSRICGFTELFQRAMEFRSHNFIDKFKQAHSDTQSIQLWLLLLFDVFKEIAGVAHSRNKLALRTRLRTCYLYVSLV